LYTGVTVDLIKRIWEHRNKVIPGFTSKYNVDILIYFEEFEDINLAIAREKRLKDWPRQWKINLITKENPNWEDLYDKIVK
jgi:putative endonuclease